MVIMQGDAYPVTIELEQCGTILTPDIVDDVEVCVGTSLRKSYACGEVGFDTNLQQWYILLTQEETLAMPSQTYPVIVRVKYKGEPVSTKGIQVGKIWVIDTHSKEVL